jgi:hypothetical protein
VYVAADMKARICASSILARTDIPKTDQTLRNGVLGERGGPQDILI